MSAVMNALMFVALGRGAMEGRPANLAVISVKSTGGGAIVDDGAAPLFGRS